MFFFVGNCSQCVACKFREFSNEVTHDYLRAFFEYNIRSSSVVLEKGPIFILAPLIFAVMKMLSTNMCFC